MERRGPKYVRYADDFSVYCKSNYAKPVRQATSCIFFERQTPSAHQSAGAIRRPVNFTLLGYGFAPTYVKGERGKYQLVVSDKSWKNLKEKLKTITKKTTSLLLTNASISSKKFNEVGYNTSVLQVCRPN